MSLTNIPISIYSTCKRISQKLLRNVVKFFHVICGQDVVLQGAAGSQDVRVMKSYPSKVGAC